MELFCKHYQDLVQRLQPARVCNCMLSKGLLHGQERSYDNFECSQ